MSLFAALFDRKGRQLMAAESEKLSRAITAAGGCGISGALPAIDAGFRLFVQQPSGAWSCAPMADGLQQAGLSPESLLGVARALALPPEPQEQLLEAARGRWGAQWWSRLSGRFAALLFDSRARTLQLARDPLGPAELVFFEQDGLTVATNWFELLMHWPGQRWRLDAEQLAGYFAIEGPALGKTYFEGIREVARGSVVELSVVSENQHRFWDPNSIEPLRLGSDSKYVAVYLEHIGRATERLVAEPGAVGVMLSGGLDSNSLAAVAARLTGERGRLGACSWTFDELVECDERRWQQSLLNAGDYELIRVAGDRLWPFCRSEHFGSLRSSPEENPYRALKSALYRTAAERGRTRLLNGGPADILQRGGSLYLRDLLRDRRWGTAATCWLRQLRLSGIRAALGAAARVAFPQGRRAGASGEPDWLTAEARECLRRSTWELSFRRSGVGEIVRFLETQARSQTLEARYASIHGVEVLSPYWSLDFVEFMLALPSHQTFRPGTTKFIARNAMSGIVPDAVRLRQESSSLEPLFDRGLFDRERETVQDLLYGGKPVWNRFVEAGYLRKVSIGSGPVDKVLLWRCASFEHWRRRHGWEVS